MLSLLNAKIYIVLYRVIQQSNVAQNNIIYKLLLESGYGCHIGNHYMVVLSYADVLAILSPSLQQFAIEYIIKKITKLSCNNVKCSHDCRRVFNLRQLCVQQVIEEKYH